MQENKGKRSQPQTASHLFFSAIFLAFSLLGASQAASNARKLSRK